MEHLPTAQQYFAVPLSVKGYGLKAFDFLILLEQS